MAVLFIGAKSWKDLLDRIERIERAVEGEQGEHLTDEWVDGETVCRYLKISPRTLQRLRSQHAITYSVLNRKLYYSLEEIKRVLHERSVQRK